MKLDTGIKSRWSLTAPTTPVAPVAANGNPISAKRIADYVAKKANFRISTQEQDTLLAAIYLDPNLLHKIWEGLSGEPSKRRQEWSLKELDEFKDNPHLFWRKPKNVFEDVATVARRFLCIQSTSCKAERVFSKAGYLNSNRKSGLSTSHLRLILFSISMIKA
ncbi:hypothetical protein BGZ98_002282 [Dissophora globulifera]|nr:hypothetical protein BGZ98_002282 [Dissophora globulifera]